MLNCVSEKAIGSVVGVVECDKLVQAVCEVGCKLSNTWAETVSDTKVVLAGA